MGIEAYRTGAGAEPVSGQAVFGDGVYRSGSNAQQSADFGCSEHQASASSGLRTPLAPVLATWV